MNKKTFNNIKWLFILNIFNVVIPYLIFPYVTRVLTPIGFGLFSFSISFLAYFQTFIDYGYNLTGAREVAIYAKNKDKISEIFSTIFISKFLLLLISLPLYLIIVMYFGQFQTSIQICFILIIMLIGNMLMPTWFYQGLQKVKVMTVISVIVRFLFVLSVFVLIKDEQDINLYTFLYAFSFFLIGLISFLIAIKGYGIKFKFINLLSIIQGFKEGFYIFLSTIVITIVSSTAVFVLGIFSDSQEIIGYYSGAQKIVSVITMLFYPIGQGLFPVISKKYKKGFIIGLNYVKKISIILIPSFIMITFLLIFSRNILVNIILGESYMKAADYLVIMSFIPLCSIISNILGTQILVASGNNKAYSKAFFKSGIVYITLFILLGYLYKEIGIMIAQFIGDVISLLFLFYEVNKVYRFNQKSEVNK